MRVVITGAAGRIGTQVVTELSTSHELTLIDRRPLSNDNSIKANLARHQNRSKFSSVTETFFGTAQWWKSFARVETVIHLAEEPSFKAGWQQILDNNVTATWNVMQAAIEHRVARVIYASSEFAVKMHEQDLAPKCYQPDGPKIASNAPARPMTPYGIGKALGETMGRGLIEDKRLHSFLAVRLGHFNPKRDSTGRYPPTALGIRDLRSLIRRCVEAEFFGFHVIYGVSAQTTAPFDLSYTKRLLSWEPVESFQ